MDREEYINRLKSLGNALIAHPSSDALARRAYINQLVAFGGALLHPEHSGTEAGSAPDLADFRRVIMGSPHDILWRVAGATARRRRAMSPSQRAMLGVLELWPDLLGPLQRENDELAHSALLAHFLDPRHGGEVGAACLAAFFDLLLTPGDEAQAAMPPDKLNAQNIEVRAERHLGKHGRVDISVETANTIMFIEVKVGATEGPQQLSSYAKALEALCSNSARQSVLVFLTQRADQKPSTKHAVHHITFRQLIGAWLPISIAGRSAEHLYLSLYLKTLACHLYDLADADAFDCWPLATQRRAMQFLETEVVFT